MFAFPDIEILTRIYDPKASLGANRQALVEMATGTYVNFIDDDDLVPANYIKTIYPLLDGVHYIGFQLQYFCDGEKQIPTFHSLKYPGWSSDKDGYYRDISHVNPILRTLAQLESFEGGVAEDQRWGDRLRERGVVKTEHYVDSVMYLYYYRSNKDDGPGGSKYTVSGVPAPVHGSYQSSGTSSTPAKNPPCPKCEAICVVVFSNGLRCNACGHQWA